MPEPETPLTTTSSLRGSSRSIPLRLCSRAPFMVIRSTAEIWLTCELGLVARAWAKNPVSREAERLISFPPG